MITIKREGLRAPSPEFQRKLRDYNEAYGAPEVAVVWNPESVMIDREMGLWDPRWEIWIEVVDNTKQGRRAITSEYDVRDGDRMWRFLNTWKNADGSFAPLDDRVFKALRIADSWAHSNTYHDHVVDPERKRQEEINSALRDIAYGARDTAQGYTRSRVGFGTRGNWRAKEIWR